MDQLVYLFSPSELVTALIMMGVLRLMDSEEHRLSWSKLTSLLITVLFTMWIVRSALYGMGAPHWTRYAAYLVVWFVVLTQVGKVRAISASVVVAVLLAIHLALYAIQERFTRVRMPDGEYVSPSEARKLRAKKPEQPSRSSPSPEHSR